VSICKCDASVGEGPCPCHPTGLTCELCHRALAENWTIEQRYDQHTGLGYYEAIPVCHDCTPKVAMGDRPDDTVAVVGGLGLIGAFEGV
jgi:hypothetical protein